MTRNEVLGGFEHRVLLAAAHLRPGAYTAPVTELIESRTGRSVAPAAVYIALQRLEKRGLTRSELRVDEASGDRRPRRYFHVTEAGLEHLARARSDLTRLWDGLELPEGGWG